MNKYSKKIICFTIISFIFVIISFAQTGLRNLGFVSKVNSTSNSSGTVSNSLVTNLIAFYKMDESGSNPRLDSSGNGYSLYVNGTVNQVSGDNIIDYAADNTGGTGRLTNTFGSELRSTGDFTIAYGIYCTNANNYHLINGTNSLSGSYNYLIAAAPTTLTIYALAAENKAFTGLILTNTYIHLTIVYTDSDKKIKLYTNGVAKATSTAFSGSLTTKTCPVYVLGRHDAGTLCINGWIDDLGFWGRALTVDEVFNLFTNRQAGVTYPW